MARGLMNRQGEVHRFIVDNFLFGEEERITDTVSLMDEGIIDSTGLLELIMFLEETYGISIADEELVPENLDSVVNIERYINCKLVAIEEVAGVASAAGQSDGETIRRSAA